MRKLLHIDRTVEKSVAVVEKIGERVDDNCSFCTFSCSMRGPTANCPIPKSTQDKEYWTIKLPVAYCKKDDYITINIIQCCSQETDNDCQILINSKSLRI